MGVLSNERLVTFHWFNSNGSSWCRSPVSCKQVNLTPNQFLKTAKEIYVDNRIRTVLECTFSGATTYVKPIIDTKDIKGCNWTPLQGKYAKQSSCPRGLVERVWSKEESIYLWSDAKNAYQWEVSHGRGATYGIYGLGLEGWIRRREKRCHNHMIGPDQQLVLDTLNALLQNSREKERTMTKPNTPTLALPSLEEALNKAKESINDW